MGGERLRRGRANLFVTSPDTWDPFKQCDELTPTAGGSGPASVWRIADTSSFGSPGEQVTFTLDGGSVAKLRFGGISMWPETRWADVEKQLLPGAKQVS